MTSAALLQPEIETLAVSERRALQERLWSRQWEHVRHASAFYRERLAARAQRALTLDGLQDLPPTDKDDLRAAQEAASPFGTHLAAPEASIVRVHRTSGTTGRAMVIGYTRRDAEVVAAQGGRAFFASGLRPGDRVVHCLNYCLWTGGLTDHLALEAAGATVVPFGVGQTRQLLLTVRELGITAISCTPSYPALLERTLREELGIAPRELGLRLGLFGGEAGLDNAAWRRALEETWGFRVRNANFGLSEVMSIMASQCETIDDLHFHAEDAVFAEVLDLRTTERLPIAEGTTGELVCTHLARECQPLVRYRTRDVITVTGAGPCGCGRTAWRFRVAGRTDEMFNVRGVNVFPTAVQRILASHPALTSGHFRIRLEGPGPYDRIALMAEAAPGLLPPRWTEAAAALEGSLRAAIGASARVILVAYETLPRTGGKTVLVERA